MSLPVHIDTCIQPAILLQYTTCALHFLTHSFPTKKTNESAVNNQIQSYALSPSMTSPLASLPLATLLLIFFIYPLKAEVRLLLWFALELPWLTFLLFSIADQLDACQLRVIFVKVRIYRSCQIQVQSRILSLS